MKKIVTILLFALTVFAGCSEETRNPRPPRLAPVRRCDLPALRKRAEERACGQGGDARRRRLQNKQLTYTFEAWTKDAKPRCVLHKTANGTLDEAAIEIALVPGTYDFLFWADYGKGTYATDNLRQSKDRYDLRRRP